MGKRWKQRSQPRGPRAPRWVALGLVVLVVVVVAASGVWWLSAPPSASSGTPRLVLDRDTVDLGHLGFETPARVVFTLRNEGDGPLRIVGVPRVRVLQGC